MSEMSRTGALTCPKCGGAMRTYERSGITVDQCSECRGIFLDRGELERLIDAEGSYYGEPGRREGPGERAAHGQTKRRRPSRLSFLGELFEGGD